MNGKLAVRVIYPCYMCTSSYTEGPLALDHMFAIHGLNLPKGPTGRIRPENGRYTYIRVNETDWEQNHLGCSSCWFHTKHKNKLQEHVRNEHGPDETSGNDNLDDDK
ncbi:hypothetical protein EDC94DRAFT_130526 [Helicostylum pulchrum]|nr:hypothetical protein EDC94DRAFT_130526 [Helicostylum pulchrum]